MTAAEARSRAHAEDDRGKLNGLIFASILSAIEVDRRGSTRAGASALKEIGHALLSDSLDAALRLADRAWRDLPDDAQVLAGIYGRLVALEARQPDAALRLLQRFPISHPDVAALTAHSLIQLRRRDDARESLERSLGEFCVSESSLLAHVAASLLSDPDIPAGGWVGIDAALDCIGELRGPIRPSAIEVSLEGSAAFTQPLYESRNGDLRFRFKLPSATQGMTVRISCCGAPLIGSGLKFPSHFGLDGRATSTRRGISGWARIGWSPARRPELRVQDDEGRTYSIKTGKVPLAGYHWPFALATSGRTIHGGRLHFAVRLPDGNFSPLPDSPLILDWAVKPRGLRVARLPPARAMSPVSGAPRNARPSIDIIIPVFRGREETLACINAALATKGDAALVVIDDASDDPQLAEALAALEANGSITLLRNSKNLGFAASVNRGLALNTDHDAVLLNSDALVFGDWLARLRSAAYRSAKVGTVTPFTNSGSIAGYPHPEERSLCPEEAASLHRLASSANADVSHEIPVGVGFCLYVRRDCWREVGEFDVSLFGRGYGEETDFCLRARRLGWSHVLAAGAFVYHLGGLSFGSQRAALLDRSRRLLNLRYPGYDREIARFLALDPLKYSRRRLDERRLAAAAAGRVVLLMTLALNGGVARFVAERCRELRARGFVPVLLRPTKRLDRRQCELSTEAVDVPNLRYEIPADLDGLKLFLETLRVREIEIHHFLHLDPKLIEIVRAMDAPHDVFIHDYAWVCPRITLIDGSGTYCGEPAVSACNSCIRRNGSHLGEKISVAQLRLRSESWLKGARRVVVPSRDAATRLRKYFSITPEVRPLASPEDRVGAVPPPTGRKTVRVAVIGAIGAHKGYRVLLNCARDARTRRLPLEFVVIGYTEQNEALRATGNVFITGRYDEGEAQHLLRREAPDVAFLPSVYPETWCYALDEAIAAGLPVVAFELGALAERIRTPGNGCVLPLNQKPRDINERLLEVAAQRVRSDLPIGIMPRGIMGQRAMVNKLADSSKATDSGSVKSEALSASVQVLPLPPGLYLFSVQAATPTVQPTAGQLALPAMHVGLGPGVRADQVEFVGGPANNGSWLFAKDDLLVIKVCKAGATMVLTSIRAASGEVLAIKVQRLEGGADAAPAPQLPPPAAPVIAKPVAAPPAPPPVDAALPLRIGAHIRARGDMSFSATPWAGRIAPGLWLESFSITPLEHFEANDIEYKGLTGNGFETPWLSDGKMCGTQRMSVPLVGFAVRFKSGAKAAAYDCEYSGYFKSGVIVGPLHNGAPCRSTVANDPLEGIQVRIYKSDRPRRSPEAEVSRSPKSAAAQSSPRNGTGPSFGTYRDANQPSPATNGRATKQGEMKAKASVELLNRKPSKTRLRMKEAVSARTKANGTSRSGQRSIARRS